MLASRDLRAIGPAASIFDLLRRHPDNARVTTQDLSRLPASLRTFSILAHDSMAPIFR